LQSGNIPNRLLVVRKALPRADQAKILDAFLALGDTSSGDRLLEAMNTKGFVAFSHEDYEAIRNTLQHMNTVHQYRQ
jgi:ABC-type phosphate/phosphonate transport system substrate-binding protein